MKGLFQVLNLYQFNETYLQFDSDDRGILEDLSEYFTFEVEGAKFMPAYKNKYWDGKIRLCNLRNQTLYKGLLLYIIKFCKDRNIHLNIDSELKYEKDSFSFDEFIDTLNLSITPYDFQIEAFKESVKRKRLTILSPTSSGKSFSIYLLIRYALYNYKDSDKKILITVPTIDLTSQLLDEFVDYDKSFNIRDHVHIVKGGEEKSTDKKTIISTWQSVYKESRDFYDQFMMIIADEAHQCKAESIKGIFEKSISTKYRFGFTGTLDGLQYNKLIIEGLCGPVYKTVSTKELMDREIVSELKIKCMKLNYDKDICKTVSKLSFQEEQKLIESLPQRNQFIKKIANNIDDDKNVLILALKIEHIKTLETIIKNDTKKDVYVVYGGTEAEQRENIRKLAGKKNGIIIIATYGVYSTGINIKNLQYIINAVGAKSTIRVLQSIGRGLRKDGKDNKITVIDIVDDFTYNKKQNYALKHFLERIGIYIKERFSYKIYNINIETNERVI